MLTPSSRSSSQQENKVTEAQVTRKKGKRTKNPPIRIVGKRIYDPKNGKTCHQEEMNCKTNSSGGDDEVIMSDVIPLLWPDLLDDEELEIALFGKAGDENSLDENNCSKLDTPKDQNTSLEVSMEREFEKLIEISNGTSNNVDDAFLSRSRKRFKICNEDLEGDSNSNDCP
ncbi:hypothetical protein Lal_00040273 [Lupinus albus]|nr:hypothetical protein Lal_00040273 [Lupinus albus]